jgi:hypothetical protein
MVRVEPIPLRLQVPELQQAPRGARVEVSVMSVDLLLLTASVRVVQMLDQQSEVLDTQTEIEEEIIEPIVELSTETPPNQSNDSTATE